MWTLWSGPRSGRPGHLAALPGVRADRVGPGAAGVVRLLVVPMVLVVVVLVRFPVTLAVWATTFHAAVPRPRPSPTADWPTHEGYAGDE
jgi:hypothetical protein